MKETWKVITKMLTRNVREAVPSVSSDSIAIERALQNILEVFYNTCFQLAHIII